MVKVQGKIVFPGDVENFVIKNSFLSGEYQIIVDLPGELDILKLKVEYELGISDLKGFKKELEKSFEKENSIKCEIELVPKGTMSKTQFKAKRIVKTYD